MSSGATEEGSVFSPVRKIQIVWSACLCFEQFKAELNNLNFTRRDDFNGDYKLCQEKFLLAEQHKKDGLVQPVAQGKLKTDAQKNSSNQKKTRFESGTKKCEYCCKWGHHKSDCNENPANRKHNPVSYGGKRPYPANNGSAGGNKRKFLSKEEFIANLKAKRELEHNQYEAYCLEQEGNGEYDEA